MNKQQIVLANILYYDTARHFLPKVNKNWFTDPFAKKLIDVMTDMYFNDETIDIVTLAQHFERIDMVKIVKLQQEASGSYACANNSRWLPSIHNQFSVLGARTHEEFLPTEQLQK